MSQNNKEILLKANAAITAEDHEGFLACCTDDVIWKFVGDQVIKGKEAVRKYMAETYVEPPVFDIESIISEGDIVTAVGSIALKDKDGKTIRYEYCDIWKFRDHKMEALKAFVIENQR